MAENQSKNKRSYLESISQILQITALIIIFIPALGFLVIKSAFEDTLAITPFAVAPQALLTWGGIYVYRFFITIFPQILFYSLASFIVFMLLMVLGLNFVALIGARLGIAHRSRIADIMINKEAQNYWAKVLKSVKSNFGAWKVFVLIVTIALLWLNSSQPTMLGLQPNFSKLALPPKIILIFKDNENATLFSLSVDSTQERWTKPVIYLLELSDGILVQDSNGTVVAIKNDMIAGIIHESKMNTSPYIYPLF